MQKESYNWVNKTNKQKGNKAPKWQKAVILSVSRAWDPTGNWKTVYNTAIVTQRPVEHSKRNPKNTPCWPIYFVQHSSFYTIISHTSLYYTLVQVIPVVWLVLAYDLLEDRRTIDDIITKFFLLCQVKWRNVSRIKMLFYVNGRR